MKVPSDIDDRLDALEDAYGAKGTIEFLCILDGLLCIPQSDVDRYAIEIKRNRLQDQLQEWAKLKTGH